jgi:dicarboxylate/amino acid:cation (Na+ or H+) symporter, DAACS family
MNEQTSSAPAGQHGPSPRAMLLSMALAIGLGVLVQLVPALKPASEWIIEQIAGPLGQLFLRALFMLVVPLLFSGLVVGIAELDLRRLGRIGARTLFYTVLASTVSVVIGLLLVNIVQPGAGATGDFKGRRPRRRARARRSACSWRWFPKIRYAPRPMARCCR